MSEYAAISFVGAAVTPMRMCAHGAFKRTSIKSKLLKGERFVLSLHGSDVSFIFFLLFHCSESVFLGGRSFAQPAFSSNFL